MKCWLAAADLLVIAAEDLPAYKKGGSIVRNNYFWALQAIACHSGRGRDWEFDEVVWVALGRLLLFFLNSGYLMTSETLLEFPCNEVIPLSLRSVATWQAPGDDGGLESF